MSTPALSTQGLDKRFGSLVVASDVNLVIPHGVRYALIGPNGAGKTTLINLITGMLRPDAGKILLGDADITAFRPDARVKRGLVRTFQINALFPHLNALEAVTLAVCERRGVAGEWWKPLPAYPEAVEEAYGILGSLMLGANCYRLTRELAGEIGTALVDEILGAPQVTEGDIRAQRERVRTLLQRLERSSAPNVVALRSVNLSDWRSRLSKASIGIAPGRRFSTK